MAKHFFSLRFVVLFIAILFLVSCAPAAPGEGTEPAPTAPAADPTSNVQNVAPTPVPEVTMGTVVVDLLNIREGPGTSYPILGSLNQGEKFPVLGEVVNNTNNKWLLITAPTGSLGWVIGDQTYVTVQAEIVDLNTFLTWQKNVNDAKPLLITVTASP
jgi:hypothetical protein